ncbi:MAG: hypothetical protein AAF942_08720, partial [Pseudomonadota bacterium]
MLRRLVQWYLFLFLTLLLAPPFAVAAGEPPDAITVSERRLHEDIHLFALAATNGARQEISVLSPADGLDRIVAALDLIDRSSPSNAKIIQRLKRSGRVSVVYYPNNFRNRTRLNTQTVALFVPDFLKRNDMGTERREFVVVINQFGVKWPVAELAAVIVHELAGHGLQHLAGRIANGRVLDLECEASLYQEQAYQDFGLEKKMRTIVLFRRQMEFHYCSDFRRYLRDRAPKRLALWDELNPDVPAILEDFRDYRGTQSATRVSTPS